MFKSQAVFLQIMKLNLNYPHNTAGRKMIINVPTASRNDSVKKVLGSLRDDFHESTINYIYVIDNDKLAGIVSIKKLMFSKDDEVMQDLMKRNFAYVSPECDEEKIADLMVKQNIKAVPVIKRGVFLGVVPNDKILTILNNSLTHDIIHFAGIHKSFLKYRNLIEVPFIDSVKQRLPWLLIGFFGIMLGAGFISSFEEILKEHIILAAFIPVIVYMSGAMGSQHQTLLIRDIALMDNRMDMLRYFFKVLGIGIVLGGIIGLLVYVFVSTFWKDSFIGIIIGVSLMITLIVSSVSSFLITYSMSKLKSDPAAGSGPFATIISDVTSIVVYFIITYIFLGA